MIAANSVAFGVGEGAKMSGDTLFRQWLMLRAVPRYPARRPTPEIVQLLQKDGYKVTARTVQRDLEKLSAIFGLSSEVEGRTNYWFYPKEHRLFDLPGMDTGAALALLLAEQQAAALLPPTTFERIRPHLTRAREVVREAVPARLSRWNERFKVIHRGPVLKPPALKVWVQEAAYEAVLTGKQLRVHYRGRSDSAEREQLLHPYVAVLREGVVYLVASAWDYTDLRHYALHRMASAQIVDEPVKSLPVSDVDAYVDRTFRYPVGDKPLRLKLRFEGAVGQHLIERPLTPHQTAVADETGLTIAAEVADSEELRWWILGFGPLVEVLEPRRLRSEVAALVQKMAARYEMP